MSADVKNTLIVGGSGLIGSALRKAWSKPDHRIFVLSRRKLNLADATCITCLSQLPSVYFDTIVNLAGADISKRWHPRYKQLIVDSRLGTTQKLVDWVATQSKKPEVFIQASAVGYYGARNDNFELDEESAVIDDFVHQLCKQWEDTATKGRDLVERLCITRIGVVLSNNGGIVRNLRLPLTLGLGGRFGHGRQIISWIAIDDLVEAFTFLRNQKELNGVFNCTAPHPVSNAVFIRSFAKALKRPAFLHMPFFMVKLLFGEMGEYLLLRGQNVTPKLLTEAGFTFRDVYLDDALHNVLKR